MRFVDRALLQLAHPADRAAVLTPTVGDRLLGAAFEFRNVEVGPVTGVTIRDVELLPAVPDLRRFDATFAQVGGDLRWEVTGTLGATRGRAAADARIEVLLTTETRVAETTVTSVTTEGLQDVGDLDLVDARIVTDDGALPTDPQDLEDRRLATIKALLLERFSQPNDFDIDAFADARGLTTVPSMVGYLSSPRHPQRLELDLVIDGTLPSRVVNHRVVAGVLVDPDPVANLREAVEQVRIARSSLEPATEAAVPPSGMAARTELPFLLVCGEDAFDDDDLPLPQGTNPTTPAARRAARLDELQRRLQPTGIALAALPS